MSALARDLTDKSFSSDERIDHLQSQLHSTSELLEEARRNISALEEQDEASQANLSKLTEV